MNELLNRLKNHHLHFSIYLLILGILLFSSSLLAQESDSTVVAPADSLNAFSSTDIDTLQVLTPPPNSDISDPIKYWAEQISFSVKERITHLEGKAKIVYGSVTLTAGKIDLYWDENRLIATGVSDSTDSLGHAVYEDLPVLTEQGTDPINGFQLEYNFKNNRGKVLEGRTEMSPGYYRGKDIRKIGQETLFIRDGYFTTCDNEEHPHFYFRSSKMRVQLKKQAVAKPVTLYIADVPIITVPYAVFSLRRGRRSGIILPTYGQNSVGGRYLKRFGYYWAASDYWDATFKSDFYERTGFLFSGDLRYKKRYAFNGSISGNYSPDNVTNASSDGARWEVRFNHFQKIGQTTTITGSGSFVSDNSFYQDYSTNYDLRTRQVVRTSASIKKTLPGSRSLSLNFTREENLQTDRIDFTFPDLSFSQPSRSIFKKKTGGRTRWYHQIRYSYNSKMLGRGSRIANFDDSTGAVTSFDRTFRSGWKHDIVPSFSTKIFKYFSVTPSMSFEELWSPDYVQYEYDDSLDRAVAVDTVGEFRSRHLFRNMGIGVKTTLYGLFEIPFSPMKVVRHKMDPSIGFSYQPDYSDESFGYYQRIDRPDGGEPIYADRFANSVFSRTPQGEQRNMNIRVNNLFQGKIIRDGEEKKIDLFRVNFNTSHNFAKDSLRWNNLSTSLQSRLHQNLNLTFNSTHTFYENNGRRNKLVWDDGFELPNLLNWTVNMNYNVSLKPPEKKKKDDKAVAEDSVAQDIVDAVDFNNNQNRSFRDEEDEYEDFDSFNVPWNVDMGFNFRYSDSQGRISRTFSSNISARVKLTENWNVAYRANVNLRDREIVNQNFNISRELHCWQMNFSWSPNPNFSYFRLEIRVKESLLRDLKLTKTSNGNRPF